MCGINGIYAFNQIGHFFSINLHAANESIKHRGPDAGKLFTESLTGLGHRRLSIIDLSPDGHQPMSDESGRYTIAFNGEIYNYLAIKNDLENKGFTFNSQSDTEVLLKAYISEREKCLEKLNGFFSFVVYDKEEDSLFLARDRFGIKPLVYYQDEDKFIFGSEIQSLLKYNIPKEIDICSMHQYFQFNYIPAPYSIFKNIFKLLPGHYMKLKGRDQQTKCYYQHPVPGGYDQAKTYEGAKSKLLELLDDAVKLRMVSDVPLGAFLSGGIDSSSVVAMASRYTDKLNTFSIGYHNEPLFDETKYANLVAEKYKTNHQVFKLGPNDFFAHIFDLLDFYAEPFADASAIPFYILSQRTRQKVTVALSGDGADEIFAGYNKYLGEFKARENGLAARLLKSSLPILDMLPKTRNSFIGNKFRQFHRFSEGMHRTPAERYWYLSSWMPEDKVRNIFTKEISDRFEVTEFDSRKEEIIKAIKGEDFNEVLYADQKLLLQNDMLHKVDSMSMANSLEVRVPFLDHRMVEFAAGLSSQFKISGKIKKMVLQDAMRDLLPAELYRRPKQGFEVPLTRGFRTDLKSWITNELLEESFIKDQGLFEPSFISGLRHKIFKTNNFDQNQVWGVLAFQHWWRKYEPKLNAEEEV